MSEQNYKVIAMQIGDHSKWKTIDVKAKDSAGARKKAKKKFAKLPGVWEINSVYPEGRG